MGEDAGRDGVAQQDKQLVLAKVESATIEDATLPVAEANSLMGIIAHDDAFDPGIGELCRSDYPRIGALVPHEPRVGDASIEGKRIKIQTETLPLSLSRAL